MIKLKQLSIITSMTVSTLYLAVACCDRVPNSHFELKGEVSNYAADKIFLTYYSPSQEIIKDSCIVQNGKFKFSGNINEPQMAYLSDMNYRHLYNSECKSYIIYIEPSKMKFRTDWSITLNDDNKQNQFYKNTPYELTGSKTDDEARIFYKMISTRDEKSYRDSVMTFIKRYPDSYISATSLDYLASILDAPELDSLCNSLGENAKSYTPYITTQKTLADLYKIQPGKPAPDFTRADINGNTIKLSDFKGKFVLLDFWASWCKPCREGMPHIKELYQKYKDKNLVVICISDNDSDPDGWKEAIKSDKTSDFIHILRGLKTLKDGSYDRSNDISNLYMVHYIPSKFLIDTNGILAGVKMEDEELDAKLKEIFNY